MYKNVYFIEVNNSVELALSSQSNVYLTFFRIIIIINKLPIVPSSLLFIPSSSSHTIASPSKYTTKRNLI